MKRIILFFIAFTLSATSFAQDEIQFKKLKELEKKEKKLIMVFIQTDWCKYCAAMKQTIIKNKEVSGILGRSFYTVFLNAEEKQDIIFAGRTFKYKATGTNTGIHGLAEQLGTINGQISYPSVCFLNENNEIIYQYNGYLNPAAFVKTLNLISGH